jgi:hypothetical protein
MVQAVTTLIPVRGHKSSPDITGAHAHMIERLAAIPPDVINPFLNAYADELQLRADTLRCNMRAFEAYVVAFMRDTADSTYALHIERKYLDGLFDDIIADTAGAIESAAETVRENGPVLQRLGR